MSASETVAGSRSLNALLRVLGGIERLGNRLPHPFWLFVILAALLALTSWGLAAAGVSAVNPATGKTVVAKNLLSADGVRMMVGDAVTNYTSLPPLGTILVVMLGVAVAERSGLLAAVLRSGVSKVSPKWVTFALAFTGMVAHVASDAAYVVLIPLGALAFRAVGRSPILGIVVAFVSISAGYDASPLITPTDAILSGLTTAAAHTVDPAYTVTPLANYFFSLVSSLVLAATITVVTERVLARRVESMPVDPEAPSGDDLGTLALSASERRGLRAAAIALVVYVAAVVAAVLPAGSPLPRQGRRHRAVAAAHLHRDLPRAGVPGRRVGVREGRRDDQRQPRHSRLHGPRAARDGADPGAVLRDLAHAFPFPFPGVLQLTPSPS